MNQHPIIQAMKNAGSLTQRQAEWLARTNYGDDETGLRVNMARLADAMVGDWTYTSAIGDVCILNARNHPDHTNARNRQDLRVQISEMLVRIGTEYRERIIDQLAAGNGAEEARALKLTADCDLAGLLARVRSDFGYRVTTSA